jgi:hypothetical protein
MTAVFFRDGYADRPHTRRGEIEERIRALKAQLWFDPGDKVEIEGMIEALEAELLALDRTGGLRRRCSSVTSVICLASSR